MGPGQIAVIWMMHDQQQAAEAASRRQRPTPRPSFTARIGDRFRRFAFRGQLGPVTGSAAA